MTTYDAHVPAARRVDLGAVRTWLGLDAAVTAVNAVVYLAAAGVVTDLLGGSTATVRVIGGGLLLFAAFVALVARLAAPAGAPTRAVVAVNVAWVAASAVVAATGALDLDAAGRVWALAQALVVGALTVMQVRTGWRSD